LPVVRNRFALLLTLLLALLVAAGCHTPGSELAPVPPAGVPRELEKVNLPDYRVEPPDILLIEAVRAIPKPPYRVEPLDVLLVQVTPTLPDEPISGPYGIEPDGTINFGPSYGGAVKVVGMTTTDIQKVLEKHFRDLGIKNPKVNVGIAQARAAQRISGPHLVRPDGTIALGTYGSVRVSGLTLAEVRKAVEAQLSEFLLDPEVSVDVQNYNSKLYYVILDGGGIGQTVYRLPVTGNDTILDAISQVNGLAAVSSKDRIWVSRPAPAGAGHQILPVDWRAVSECGDTATNYQLMPGDRVFVASYPAVRVDAALARVIAPVERMFGVTLLGNATIRSLTSSNANGGIGGFGGFGGIR
jgi:polysaccharide export outer membrane protein